MTEGSAITDEMRSVIGQETEPLTVEVDKTAIRMFARAVGHTDLIFYDEEYAKSKGHRGLVCPPGFAGHAIHTPLKPTNIIGSSTTQMPDIKTKIVRVLNGGTEFEYFDDICAGDVLTAVSKITDIRERAGASGAMLFVVRETSYTNQQGKLLAVERGTAIMFPG